MRILVLLVIIVSNGRANEILGCGGFVKSHASIDFSKIGIGLYTKEGLLKEKTECAPNNGYYFLPLYEKGDYVLKIHPPAGWSFAPTEVSLNVDGISDPCSRGQDINFDFNGFGIAGRVLTAGQKDGPAGIAVELIRSNGEKRETVTSAGGEFHFTPIIPGKYTIKGFHSKWSLSPSSAEVTVTEGKTELPTGILIVKGYDVQGTITAFGSPISGIHVLLYSKEKNQKYRVEGCKTGLLQGVPDAPICYSVTDNTGTFSFGIVPAGNYFLRALSKSPGETQLQYNIKPDEVPFRVLHNGLVISNAFEITHFTLTGVVERATENAMSDVQILLNGKPAAVSDKFGKYTLTNLKPGRYRLAFISEISKFDDSELVITPSGFRGVLITRPSTWRVCGRVVGARNKQRDIVFDKQDGGAPDSVRSDEEGKWCTYLPNGIYSTSVSVSDEDKQRGLRFFPLNQNVVVDHRSVDNVEFSQLKATLRGRVVCHADGRGQCDHIVVSLQSHGNIGQPLIATLKDSTFVFTDLLPGTYDLSVPSDRLCWQKNSQVIVVNKAEVEAQPFKQDGYKVYLTTSHDVEVEYSLENTKPDDISRIAGKWNVPAGPAAVCVPAAGKYKLVPRACHRFAQPELFYSTDKPDEVIIINAVSHLTGIAIISEEKLTDLKLVIEKDGKETIGPLSPKSEKENNKYVYEHYIYLAPGETVVLTALTEQALIWPRASWPLTGNGSCQTRAVELHVRRAVIHSGRVRPAVEGVEITLRAGDEEQTVLTNSEGKYRFGPSEQGISYSLSAFKESYAFAGPDENGDFKAHQLAQIIVKFIDSVDNTSLNSVVVSVSGGDYRRNLMSPEDGRLVFASLAPAEYYVKPLMKENRFEPQHTIVNVEEGKTYELVFRGVRVAWSVRGRVVWAGGRGASATTVTARSDSPNCPFATTNADSEGHFVLRALPPHCDYTVQASSEIQITTDRKDTEGLTLIALKPVEVTDVNVLVIAPEYDHYKTLKLKLNVLGQSDTTVFSSKIDASGFSNNINPGIMIVLPRLPADNSTYEIILESTLSKTTHSYETMSAEIKADGRFKHLTFEFRPKVKAQEQELMQTSFLVLPLLGIIGFLIFNKDQVLAILGERAGDLSDKILQAASKNKQQPALNLQNVLDEKQINQIVQNVNSVNRRNKPRKT